MGKELIYGLLLGVLRTGQIGIGRDDGDSKGEFNPIFYKKSVTSVPANSPLDVTKELTSARFSPFLWICRSVFKLIIHDTFWLS